MVPRPTNSPSNVRGEATKWSKVVQDAKLTVN